MISRTATAPSSRFATRRCSFTSRQSGQARAISPGVTRLSLNVFRPTSRSVGLKSAFFQKTSRFGLSAFRASSNGSNSSNGVGSSSFGSSSFEPEKKDVVQELLAPFQKFASLWRKFLPMVLLFFMLSFVNTVVDSLKDTLVITAVGGGAEVIPYLTVYAVLPVSVLFLVAYSYATLFLSRAAVFNAVVTTFMGFFAFFAFVLYPNHNSLHLHELAETLSQVLPAGLSGVVGMIRNWTFTLFFCFSELWGDVGLGLLFWTLANDITSVSDAPVLYPMFGLGANAAQALAGGLLNKFSSVSAAMNVPFDQQLQVIMMVVLGCSGLVMAMHHYITVRGNDSPIKKKDNNLNNDTHQSSRDVSSPTNSIPTTSKAADSSNFNLNSATSHLQNDNNGYSSNGNGPSMHVNSHAAIQAQTQAQTESSSQPSSSSSNVEALERMFMHARGPSNGTAGQTNASTSQSSSYDFTRSGSTTSHTAQNSASGPGTITASYQHASGSNGVHKKKEKDKLTLTEAYQVLAQSIEIRSLAVMSIAQGLCASLMEFAWKCHIKILYPSPSDFTAYLGEVACWTGIVTGTLMLASPLLFDRLKWQGVAESTPQLLLFGGSIFFITCIAFQQFFAGSLGMSGAQGALALVMLNGLVAVGALLYICSRGAKYSLYKPAEEMVYICMDDNARTKGKAAIDVVGAQLGKSSASVLQQVLLLISAGTLVGILPVMFIVFFGMLRAWMKSVLVLSQHFNFEEEHRRSMMSMSQEDEGDEEGGSPVSREDRGGKPSGTPGHPAPSGIPLGGYDGTYPGNGNGTRVGNGSHNGNGADGTPAPASPVYVGAL